MKLITTIPAITLVLLANSLLNAQSSVESEPDQLIVFAHQTEKFGDVISAGKLFKSINESNVSYRLSTKPGIRLILLTRSKERYAGQISDINENKEIEIDFGLPPLRRVQFSDQKLKKYKSKNGVVVFLLADWCLTCEGIVEKSLREQSLLKYIYDSNIPILWADYTNAYNGDDAVAKFAKKLNLSSVPTFVVYGPDSPKPIVLTEATSAEQIEKEFRSHFSPRATRGK